MSNLIQAGDPFPRLTLESRGIPFTRPASGHGTLFYFMRTGGCPVCRAHVLRLAQLFPTFQSAGFSVVVVVADRSEATEVADRLKLPFPVVSGDAAHQSVGLGKVLFGAIQQSGTVVIDARGAVLMVVRATLPTSAFPEDDVLALLEAQKTKS